MNILTSDVTLLLLTVLFGFLAYKLALPLVESNQVLLTLALNLTHSSNIMGFMPRFGHWCRH